MKVYNQLLDYQLSPTAMKVYVYLTCCAEPLTITTLDGNGICYATIKNKTFQKDCNINSPATVYKALAELEAKGLVTKSNRYNQDGHYTTNGYYVTILSGAWFSVANIMAVLKLPKSAFMLYMYLKKRGGKKRKVWATIRAIAADLGASCNTILAALRDLISASVIKKAPRWHGKHNLYMVGNVCFEEKMPGSEVTTQRYPAQTENCTTNFLSPMIKGVSAIVKGGKKIFFGAISGVGSLFLGRVYQKMKNSIFTQQVLTVKKKE